MDINQLVMEILTDPNKMYRYGEIDLLKQNNLFKRMGVRKQQPKRVTYRRKIKK